MTMPDMTNEIPLSYTNFCPEREAVHAMRFHWDRRHERDWTVRDHWHLALVEEGAVRWEAGGQEPCLLETGWARVVPPGIPHRVATSGPGGTVEVYLLFTAALVADLAACLGPERPRRFPWRGGARPQLIGLDAQAVHEVTGLGERLSMHPPSRHEAIEALCLVLRLGDQVGPSPYADLPPWLRNAVIQLRSSRYLVDGVAALARLAGRSLDHVNRCIRRHRGITATRLVNDLRMELAAARLRLTSDPVAEVAAHVGLGDLGHFYRLFHRAHGTTPAGYRREQAGSNPPGRSSPAPSHAVASRRDQARRIT
jgi:AraC family cel operon transcriptional repressor